MNREVATYLSTETCLCLVVIFCSFVGGLAFLLFAYEQHWSLPWVFGLAVGGTAFIIALRFAPIND